MKLPLAQELIEGLYDKAIEAARPDTCAQAAVIREALAEAFIAGVRSAGLRYQPRAALLAAFDVPPETKP